MDPKTLTDRQKEILKRLEELNELQLPYLRAMSPHEANLTPESLEELEAYAKRSEEITALNDELIASIRSAQ